MPELLTETELTMLESDSCWCPPELLPLWSRFLATIRQQRERLVELQAEVRELKRCQPPSDAY